MHAWYEHHYAEYEDGMGYSADVGFVLWGKDSHSGKRRPGRFDAWSDSSLPRSLRLPPPTTVAMMLTMLAWIGCNTTA